MGTGDRDNSRLTFVGAATDFLGDGNLGSRSIGLVRLYGDFADSDFAFAAGVAVNARNTRLGSVDGVGLEPGRLNFFWNTSVLGGWDAASFFAMTGFWWAGVPEATGALVGAGFGFGSDLTTGF